MRLLVAKIKILPRLYALGVQCSIILRDYSGRIAENNGSRALNSRRILNCRRN